MSDATTDQAVHSFFAPAQRCAVMSAYFGPRWTEDHGPMRTMDRWTMDQTPFKHCSLLPASMPRDWLRSAGIQNHFGPAAMHTQGGWKASFEFVP